MYTNALALAPLLFSAAVVRAGSDELEMDASDVPQACAAICRPVVELSRRCEVDLRNQDSNNKDRTERLLERQCVCTNGSFDVARFAALCDDCIRQNLPARNGRRDDDDNNDNRDRDRTRNRNGSNNDADDAYEDIRSIMNACGFTTASYGTSAFTAAQSITVQVTAPTASSQLTTTINASYTGDDDDNRRHRTRTGDDSRATSSPGSSGGSSSSSSSNNNGGSTAASGAAPTQTGTSSGTTNGNSGSSSGNNNGNSAPGAVVPVTMAALAAVFGAFAMLA